MGAGSISVDVMTAKQERAAIVKWLRRKEDAQKDFGRGAKGQEAKDYFFAKAFAFGHAAASIECGDHHKGE